MTAKYRYFKICPRGFANEVTYIRVTNDEQATTLEREYEFQADETPGSYAGWTDDKRALMPGVAVNFEDRHWA